MSQGRSDHTLLMINADDIYVFGGMAHLQTSEKDQSKKSLIESLNTCEVYSITEDKWMTLEPFACKRQQSSVCHFNERFIFLFGGKCLKSGKEKVAGPEPFDFVDLVEVYEIDKKIWKTINYISEPKRL